MVGIALRCKQAVKLLGPLGWRASVFDGRVVVRGEVSVVQDGS
jgi:hypothetical protein